MFIFLHFSEYDTDVVKEDSKPTVSKYSRQALSSYRPIGRVPVV